MADITDRRDIEGLLRAFYDDVFGDALLRPIFVDIAHMNLEAHLPVLGDFWEKVLFDTAVYNGKAMEVHRRLHRRVTLTAEHFDRWVAIWGRTVDAEFAGPVAEQAKGHAARIAVAIQRNLPPDGGEPGGTELSLVPRSG